MLIKKKKVQTPPWEAKDLNNTAAMTFSMRSIAMLLGWRRKRKAQA
jgi:hypothetical protein